jgi:hypothetical protein
VLHLTGRMKTVWSVIVGQNAQASDTDSIDATAGERLAHYVTNDALDVAAELDRALIAAELLAENVMVEHYIHALRADLLQVIDFFHQLPAMFPIEQRVLAARQQLYVEELMANNAEALRVAALRLYQPRS